MDYRLKLSTIIVEDIEESIAFYQNTFGFKMVEKFYNEDGGLVLMQSPGGAAVELIDSKNFETGFWSMGIEVDDFETAIEELRSKDCKFIFRANQPGSWKAGHDRGSERSENRDPAIDKISGRRPNKRAWVRE